MLLALPLVILGSALAVQANLIRDSHNQVARHHNLARNVQTSPVTNLRKRKSCQAPSSTKKTATTTTKAKPKSTTAVSIPKGLIQVEVSRCGSNGATTETTHTTGPNGKLDWLNCGLTDGGWNPPFVRVSDVVSVDLKTALKSSSSPFHACADFVDIFYAAADKYGLKPIMIAAFALQESTCNPATVGGGGEQGLMQITKDKCGGAPGGNCRDPWFNIMTGSKYFSEVLDSNGGNLLMSIGNYNGWSKGLTVAKATAARYTSCCRCQNNLDYLFQWMNGWILNQNAYAMDLGKYHNLNVCS